MNLTKTELEFIQHVLEFALDNGYVETVEESQLADSLTEKLETELQK